MYCKRYSMDPQWGTGQHGIDPAVRYRSHKDDLTLLRRMEIHHKITEHNGCVNSIQWNISGTRILSASDDQHLIISDPFTNKVCASIRSGHRANIFSARFLPNTSDSRIISCSGDGMIHCTDVHDQDLSSSHGFSCHQGTCYDVVTIPNDPYTFLSCGEDGTVRLFDLRIKENCSRTSCMDHVLVNCKRAVTSVAVNPMFPHELGVGCDDSTGRLYDRRMLVKQTGGYDPLAVTAMYAVVIPPSLEGKRHRITCLQFSETGSEILASYSSNYVYLFDLRKAQVSDDYSPDSSVEYGKIAPIKRLRLRGDWSDTGPESRPVRDRGEASTSGGDPMQRMSDVLTRWFEERMRQTARTLSTDDQLREDDRSSDQNPIGETRVTGAAGTNSSRATRELVSEELTEENSASSTEQSLGGEASELEGNVHRTETNTVHSDKLRRLKELYCAKVEEKRKQQEECVRQVKKSRVVSCYRGHRNARTMIKEVCFWGDRYIMSGSDCGNIFVWDRETSNLVLLLQGDKHVVNCLQPHPSYPILASSGIDYDVKIWFPTTADSSFDECFAEGVVKRNEAMLEETRDTITVPASFMLRMLTSLNQMSRRTNSTEAD